MNKDNIPTSRITWIASLRGFAAILVFLSHLKIAVSPELMFIIGRVGVVGFFLIAGYLSLEARSKRSGLQYLFNRLVRLYPVYWLLLTVFCFVKKNVSIISYIANLSLFQEFIGFDCILGASWMLPIQIVFFCAVSFLGTSFFIDERNNHSTNRRAILVMTLAVCLACVVALLRYISKLPFPTAFCLLMAMAILGIYCKAYNDGKLTYKTIVYLIILFDVGLAASAMLSYAEMAFHYFIAYNLGILMFILFKTQNISIRFLERLGEKGMTFFLGSDIVYYILFHYLDFGKNRVLSVIGCLLQFVLTLLLAWVITKYVEEPILRKAKSIENTCLVPKNKR